MQTIPSYVAGLFWSQLSARQREALMACGRRLGANVEVDLDAVAACLGPGAADDLFAHHLACLEPLAGGDGVRLRRTLRRAVQRTAKRDRADLDAELDALDKVPGVGPYVEELTAAAPSSEALDLLGEPLQAQRRSDGTRAVASLVVDAAIDWLPVLGGPAAVGELHRLLEVTAIHAPWRDRRVRRLAGLTVAAEELWPAAPAGCAAGWQLA